jgi:hypothetical protein
MAGTSLDYEGLSIALGLTSCKVTKDVPTSAIRPTLIKAWSNLRHGAAHAAAFDINYAKPEQTQKLPVGIDKVTTLMYEIIFHLIGYEEEYTDYSEPDWPPRRLKTGTVFEADELEPDNTGQGHLQCTRPNTVATVAATARARSCEGLIVRRRAAAALASATPRCAGSRSSAAMRW